MRIVAALPSVDACVAVAPLAAVAVSTEPETVVCERGAGGAEGARQETFRGIFGRHCC